MKTEHSIQTLAEKTKSAAASLITLSTSKKNEALASINHQLKQNIDYIIEENQKDIQAGKEKGLSSALLDRLLLNDKRITGMSQAIEEIIALPDPVGRIIDQWKLPNGLSVGKIRIPIGVIGIIYESRPNVTSDAATLCLKASNAVVLRGGSESIHSNKALVEILKSGLQRVGLSPDIIGFIETTDRRAVQEMLKLTDYIDLIIPRGGEGLIKAVVENSHIPVIKHYKGVCNLYIAEDADKTMAMDIAVNAKVQRPGVCNAIENLILNKNFPYIKEMIEVLIKAGVEIRGEKELQSLNSQVKEANEADFYEEYLDMILSVKLVESMEAAISFIRKYGSGHSDAIVTKDYQAAENFLNLVDSATVYVNASTRFTDGGEFGMGAEIGISTDKLHARGPMGLMDLTTYKYIIRGQGQIRP